jgi:hypothetical protein
MITPHKGWIPANCQEVDDEWYFLIKWQDCPGGWRAKHEGMGFREQTIRTL